MSKNTFILLFKQNENGRSMVEMLGVLAVIGLLSIAGLYGYRHAMNKHKANEVINEANKRAVMAAAQIAALGDNATNEDLNDIYDDGYEAGRDDSEISTGAPSARRDGSNLRVIRYPNTDRKEFAVVIPEMEKDVCRTILNSLGTGSQIQALVDSKGYEITNCDNADLKDVEMVYKDDLSPTENNQTHYSDSDTGNGSTDTGSGGSGSSNNSDSESQAGDGDFEDDSDVCPRGTKVYGEGNCIRCKEYDDCGCRAIGMLSDGAGKCMCADEGVAECDGNKATACLEGYFLENGKCYSCPEKYKTCDNNGLTCKDTYEKEGTTCFCSEGTFDNGEKCTSDCWDQNMSIADIIRPSTQYFARCNKLCGSGKFYAYNNRNGTSCERGPIAEGACQNLPNIREKRYSASDDAKAARFLGLLDDNGNPILLGEEEALRLTQNMVWYDYITHYYNSASICDAVGMHLASIDDIGCDERGSGSRCKKNGVGSKIVQALASVYLHGSRGNIPSFISGTRNGCTPAHIWLNQAELNYDSRTSLDISRQTAGASTLCVK